VQFPRAPFSLGASFALLKSPWTVQVHCSTLFLDPQNAPVDGCYERLPQRRNAPIPPHFAENVRQSAPMDLIDQAAG
jgi:hypothetical protein